VDSAVAAPSMRRQGCATSSLRYRDSASLKEAVTNKKNRLEGHVATQSHHITAVGQWLKFINIGIVLCAAVITPEEART
jgi:hypothetical protein